VNRLKIGLFAMLMLVGVGAFAQNTMLRPASGKSGTVIKPKPKAQPTLASQKALFSIDSLPFKPYFFTQLEYLKLQFCQSGAI
jgi:hypothetical protein